MSSAGPAVMGFWLAQGDTYNGFTCPADAKTPCFVQYGEEIPVSASVSASVSGWTPNGNVASLSVTTASANVALPGGTVVQLTNTGSYTAYYKLSVGAGTAAVTDAALVAGATVGLTVGSNTYINAITSSSTTTLRLSGGAGLVSGYGGGSSGGGGSGTSDIIAVNGVTALAGAGATGTGSLRVTAAQDTTTIAGAAPLTTGVYVTGPSAAALATSANQTTINTNITTVNTNLTNLTGTKAAGTAAANSLLTGGVYSSTPPTLTNGQQAAIQVSAAGRLLVDAAITGGGDATAANQTSVQAVIGAATAPTKMNAAGGVYNSTPLTLTNGQSSALQLDANGYLAVNIKTGASSGAVAQGSTTSGQTGLLIQGAVTTSAPSYTTAQTSPLSLDTAGSLRVNVTSATGVAQASTSSGQTISPIGVRTLSTSPTDTTAQTNMPVADTKGSLVVQPYGLSDNSISGVITSAMTGTTSTSLIAAPGSGLYNYITQITVSNTHATVGTNIELQDGSGGTTFYIIPAAALYGGAVLTFPKPLKQATSNTALYCKNSTTGSSTFVSASGYKAP